MLFKMDNAKTPDGTVLIFGVKFHNQRDPEMVWTYAALKAGGMWYVTGSGRTPQAAGWGAVAKWLDDPEKVVVSIELVTDRKTVWTRANGGAVNLTPKESAA